MYQREKENTAENLYSFITKSLGPIYNQILFSAAISFTYYKKVNFYQKPNNLKTS